MEGHHGQPAARLDQLRGAAQQGRLLPGDLAQKFDPAKHNPLQRVGDHQELANLAAYLVSDYAAFVNGEVVTIDGGEWLMGAGEFNYLDEIPQPMWDQLEQMRKKR